MPICMPYENTFCTVRASTLVVQVSGLSSLLFTNPTTKSKPCYLARPEISIEGMIFLLESSRASGGLRLAV